MEYDGEKPSDKLERLAKTGNSEWYKWNGDEKWCNICGKIFDTQGALNLHKSSKHTYRNGLIDEDKNYDYGQNDLRNGVSMLWDDFLSEHVLPKVVFLYGDRWRLKKLYHYDWMPLYRPGAMLDEDTGERIDAIILSESWLDLDVEAKAVSLAHVATHIENRRNHIMDVLRTSSYKHTRTFRDVAVTYDLFVFNVPQYNFAMTIATDKFKDKHARALTLMSRYHHLVFSNNTPMPIICSIDKNEQPVIEKRSRKKKKSEFSSKELRGLNESWQ